MRKFKIHFRETSYMSQIVEAESLDEAIKEWHDQGDGCWEADQEDVETGDPGDFKESVDGEWKEVFKL